MGELLALHVAGVDHRSLRGVKEHGGGVKGLGGGDGLDPLQHVLFVCGREDKLATTVGVHLELVAGGREKERERERINSILHWGL